MKIEMDFSEGSNSGKAIYLDDTRIAGSKCWGIIHPVKTFNLDKKDLQYLIKVAQDAIKKLTN